MQKLRFVLNLIDKVNENGGRIVSILIAALIGVVVFEVVMRYGLNSPTEWGYETTYFIFGAYVVLGGGYTLLHKAHVSVDVLYSRFSPRTQAIVDLITALPFFFFVVVLLWMGGDYAWHAVEVKQTSGTPWNPIIWPVKMVIPLGALLLLLQGAAKFARDLITAISGSKSG